MSKKINAIELETTSKYLSAGMEIEYLNRIKNEIKGSRNFIFLAGDSSLDNKVWFKNINDKYKGNPLNGYENIIDGKMTKDIAYQINEKIVSNNLQETYVCINTAIEATTLKQRKDNLISPSDEFIRDHITSKDILIISVGGNDIAFGDPDRVIQVIGNPEKPIDVTTSKFLDMIELFKNDIIKYINKLCPTKEKKSKYIILNMIYYPCERDGEDTWASGILNGIKYENYKKRQKVKELIRLLYIHATSKVYIENSIVIPVPLFEVLDSQLYLDDSKEKDKDAIEYRLQTSRLNNRCTDYLQSVEPSIEGGAKMATKFVNLINLYDNKITEDLELKLAIKDLSKESNELNNNKKLDISIHSGLKLIINQYLSTNVVVENSYEDFVFQVYIFTKDSLQEDIKRKLLKALNELYENSVTEIIDYSKVFLPPNPDTGLIHDYDILREAITYQMNISNKSKNLTNFIGFKISKLPIELNPPNIDTYDNIDALLTHQEQKIQNKLNTENINIKLVEGQPGVWSTKKRDGYKCALIALELK